VAEKFYGFHRNDFFFVDVAKIGSWKFVQQRFKLNVF